MTVPSTVAEFLPAFEKAWSTQDIDQILGFFADEFTFEDIPMGFRAKTKAEMRSVLETTFASVPDFTMKITHHYEGDGFVATKWKQSGTMTAHEQGLNLDAHPYEVPTTSVITFDQQGRIRSISDNWNTGVLFM